MIRKTARLVRSIRYLRPRQFFSQVQHAAGLYRAYPDLGSAPTCEGLRRFDFTGLPEPSGSAHLADGLTGGGFVFIDESRKLGWPPDWKASQAEKLWTYNLHYFNWLWELPGDAEGYARAKEAVLDWITEYPAAKDADGWEPYPVSLRLQNWLVLFSGRWFERVEKDAAFKTQLLASTWQQAEALMGRLEYRLGVNHLFENAVALYLAGRCYAGKAGAAWQKKGGDLVLQELYQQQLGDGCHIERSPMYHLRFHWTLELLAKVAEGTLTEMLPDRIQRSRDALGHLCHPDGEVSQFNDSAPGVYTRPGHFLADRPEWEGAWSLPETGYYGWRDPGGTCLICDAGPLGPDYNPGHGHADLFSFELSLKGHRVIVDGGTSTYAPGESRARERSTRAHNTLEINGASQAELYGLFRVGRRPKVHDVTWEHADNGFLLSAWHDGYACLPGAPLHRRVSAKAEGVVRVVDEVHSGKTCTCVSRIHLHPSCRVVHSGDRATIDSPAGTFDILADDEVAWEVEEAWYAPVFGRREKTICLRLSGTGTTVLLGYTISLDVR